MCVVQEGSMSLYKLQEDLRPIYKQLSYKDKYESRKLLCDKENNKSNKI